MVYMRLFSFVVVLPLAVFGVAQDVRGAGEILKSIESAKQGKPASADAWAGVVAQKTAFIDSLPGLDDDAAAKGWVDLAVRIIETPMNPMSMMSFEADESPFYQSGKSGMLIETLPKPSCWNRLPRLIQANGKLKPNQKTALLLFVRSLTGEPSAQWSTAMKVLALSKKEPMVRSQLANYMLQVATSLRDYPKAKQAVETILTLDRNNFGWSSNGLDLISAFGKENARRLLTQMIVSSPIEMSIAKGASQRLAKEVALANVGKMKVPYWSLVDSPDDMALYQAMARRFASTKGKPQMGDYRRQVALSWYLVGLIKRHRESEAYLLLSQEKDPSSLISTITYSLMQITNGKDFIKKMQGLLMQALTKNPNLPLWYQLVNLSQNAGFEKTTASFLKKSLDRKDLTATTRSLLKNQYVDLLFSTGQVDEATRVIRTELVQEKGSVGYEGLRLVKLGRLLERPQWVETGLQIAEKSNGEMINGEIIGLLLDLGRAGEAERLVTQAMTRRQSMFADIGNGMFPAMGDPDDLALLAGIYFETNRPADVMQLLDQAPGWGADDLKSVARKQTVRDYPLGFVAAWALAKTDKKEGALKALTEVLRVRRDFDPGYRLLVDLQGLEAIPLLDRLQKADRFQERPLIWKAVALKEAGKLWEAEVAAREAISIDPTDGEQKYGRRLFGYSVLADILEARGAVEEEKRLRSAVEAVKVSEQGDEYEEAGLTRQAVEFYRKSLSMFANAYCIEARLAINLVKLGKFDEATDHYRRAYELMPDSFGRMETYCFGCENAFEGVQAQKIAETVLLRLMKERPNKPQIYYVLAQLREAQNRQPEALALMQKAVAIDPEYLNAWKSIVVDAGAQGQFSLARKALLKVARLSPLTALASLDGAELMPAQVYEIAAKAVSLLPPKHRSLYRLAGNKTRGSVPGGIFEVPTYQEETPPSAGEPVRKVRLVSIAAEIVESTANSFGGSSISWSSGE